MPIQKEMIFAYLINFLRFRVQTMCPLKDLGTRMKQDLRTLQFKLEFIKDDL